MVKKRWIGVLAALCVPAIAILALAPSHHRSPHNAYAQQAGLVDLSLRLVLSGNLNCRPSEKPDICFVDPGSQFTLSVSIDAVRASGYASYQVDIVHPGLVSKAVRHVVPSEFPIEAPTQGVGTEAFLAAALTGNQAPLPATNYLGPIVEADLDCSATEGTFKISLRVLGTLGTLVVDANNDPIPITTEQHDIDGDTTQDKAADTLLVICVDRLTVDVDGDGCTGEQELGPDESLGGLRDPKNPWDYYNPSGNQYPDLTTDILPVAFKYHLRDEFQTQVKAQAASGQNQIEVTVANSYDLQEGNAITINPGEASEETVTIATGGVDLSNFPTATLTLTGDLANKHADGEQVVRPRDENVPMDPLPAQSYDPEFDRNGSIPGGYPWSLRGPDGYIDLTTDILKVANQYHHDCR